MLFDIFISVHKRSTRILGFSDGSVDKKKSACNAGDTEDSGSIPGLGRSPGGGHGNPLQYSCLENPMERGARWAIIHGVSESDSTEHRRAHTRMHTHHSHGLIAHCVPDTILEAERTTMDK